MAFVDKALELTKKVQRAIVAFNAASQRSLAPEDQLANSTTWIWNAPKGIPRRINIYNLRTIARSSWVQQVTFAIKKFVINTEWKVVGADEDVDVEQYAAQRDEIVEFLNHPNRNGDTFDELVWPMLNDVLEHDCGVWVLGRGVDHRLLEIFPYDGFTFLKDVDEHKILKGYFQYSWRHPRNAPKPFDIDHVCFFEMNRLSYDFYGWSPLQSLEVIVMLLLQATRYNKAAFEKNVIPDGIASFDTSQEGLKRIKNQWVEEVQGKPNKLLFTNAKSFDFQKFQITNKDMQWLEGMEYYKKEVYSAFGLSTSVTGNTPAKNTDTQAGQERISVKGAVEPYLNMSAEKINRIIIPAILGEESVPYSQRTPLKFSWFPKDSAEERIRNDELSKDLQDKVRTINEVRGEKGLPDLGNEAADDPFLFGQSLSLPSDSSGVVAQGKDSKDREETGKSFYVQLERPHYKMKEAVEEKIPVPDGGLPEGEVYVGKSEGREMVVEAEDYAVFLKKQVRLWEKNVFIALEENASDLELTKTLGEFMRGVFNSINTANFFVKLKGFISDSMKLGLVEAEEDTGVDIGVGFNFDNQAKTFLNEQMNGYNAGGKHWHGLKGFTEDMQKEVYGIIRDSIGEKKTLKEIKSNLSERFDIAENRAEKIARTEINRFHNGGKLAGYKDSGVSGRKGFAARLDDFTSPVCRRLNAKYNPRVGGSAISLEENFVDEEGSWSNPPCHPYCRSSINWWPD